MRARGLFAGVLGALAVGVAGCADSPPAGPNVILLVMDTTRADRCSFLGYDRPTTPFLSSLAATSVVYANAWSPAAWTLPAHASLFTGLRPDRHGVLLGNRAWLDDRPPTLAEVLGAAGWRTACISNNPYVSPDFGLTRGFELYEGPWADAPEGETAPARHGHDRAIAFAREARAAGAPFFLFVNDMEPHLRYDPPEDVLGEFLTGDPAPEERAWGRAFETRHALAFCVGMFDLFPAQWTLLSDLYDAEIRTLDREIERFVAGLKAEGLFDDALFIVVADHGENLGEHHLAEHRMSLHRTIRHVPLLVRRPGGAAGRVDDLVRLEDVYPTVLDACGVATPAGRQGESLLRPTAGRISRATVGAPPKELLDLQAEAGKGGDWSRMTKPARAVYDGRWHLIRRDDGGEELYDHSADPREERNVAETEAGAAELPRLRTLLP